MERIVRKAATPEQTKSGAYLFALGGHPEWDRLTDQQQMMLKPFLEAVLRDEEYSEGGRWTGKKIKYDDYQ